jgi:uncharacterized protein
MSEFFGRLAARSVRRRAAVIAAAGFLALLGVAGASRLETNTGTGTFVSHGASAYGDTQRFNDQFGDEPVRILVKGDPAQGGLRHIVLTQNLGSLLRLEGCLSGRIPQGQQPAAPVCGEIASLDPSQVVYGPATFLNQAAIEAQKFLGGALQGAQRQAQVAASAARAKAAKSGAGPAAQAQAAQAAGQGTLQQAQAQLLALGSKYGQTSLPNIDNPKFVENVVFDSRYGGGVPKAKFAGLFPSADAAMITVRLRPDLSEAERRKAVGLFREAVDDPTFKLNGGSYVVGGDPVVAADLSSRLDTNIAKGFGSEVFTLLVAALALMAVALMIVLRPPLRLLPLAVAVVAVAVVFGTLGIAGGALTMASLAALPILIGLGVDYAIQFHARFREALAGGASRAEAAVLAAARGGPVIATAALATVAGLLVWLAPPVSPIPMVRSFALLVVLGLVIAFALALTLGSASLSMAGRAAAPTGRLAGLASARSRAAASLGRIGKGAVAVAITAPARVLLVALVIAAFGWVVGSSTGLVSDVTKLVPADLAGLRASRDIEHETGSSGELDVLVEGKDVTDPKAIDWMAGFKRRVLAAHGFKSGARSCRGAELCPGITLSDLFGDGTRPPSKARVKSVLGAVPPYFSQAFLARDANGKPTAANVAFGIQVNSLDDQERLIDDVRSEIGTPGSANGPPPGVSASVVGSRVLTADALSSLESSRYWLPLASLVAVALVLFIAYRRPARWIVPLIPVVLATGWSALLLAASGIDLDPMSATLGALVIAIATEFSVLLSARFHEEREAGHSVGESLRRTYARTGAAVAASGVTALVGFAVLVVSGVPMLRSFGALTVLDLAVALLGVMLVLPAALVWAEGGFEPLPRLAARSRRPAPPARPRRRRPARGARDAA